MPPVIPPNIDGSISFFQKKIIIQIPHSANPINLVHDTVFDLLPQNKTGKESSKTLKSVVLFLVIWLLTDK